METVDLRRLERAFVIRVGCEGSRINAYTLATTLVANSDAARAARGVKGLAVKTEYSLNFPNEFDDYAGEVESKGCFSEARLVLLGRRYRVNFYDPVRLAQEIESALHRGTVFCEPKVVVVRSVTRENMERAAAEVVRSGSVASLIAESLP